MVDKPAGEGIAELRMIITWDFERGGGIDTSATPTIEVLAGGEWYVFDRDQTLDVIRGELCRGDIWDALQDQAEENYEDSLR